MPKQRKKNRVFILLSRVFCTIRIKKCINIDMHVIWSIEIKFRNVFYILNALLKIKFIYYQFKMRVFREKINKVPMVFQEIFKILRATFFLVYSNIVDIQTYTHVEQFSKEFHFLLLRECKHCRSIQTHFCVCILIFVNFNIKTNFVFTCKWSICILNIETLFEKFS